MQPIYCTAHYVHIIPHQHTHTHTHLFSRWCLHSPLNIIYRQRVALFSTNTLHNGFLCKLALMALYTQECSRSNGAGELRCNAELKTNMTLQLRLHYSRAAKRVKNDLCVFTDSTQAGGSLFEFNECVSARERGSHVRSHTHLMGHGESKKGVLVE